MSFGCVAQIEQHQKLFLFRETKRLCGGFRIQEIDPAAVHALVGSRQGKVRGDDRCVLDAGIALPAGIGEDIFTVKCDGQNGRGAIAAGRNGVDFRQRLRRAKHIDVLLLQIFGGRRQASGLQNGRELLLLHLPVRKFLA